MKEVLSRREMIWYPVDKCSAAFRLITLLFGRMLSISPLGGPFQAGRIAGLGSR